MPKIARKYMKANLANIIQLEDSDDDSENESVGQVGPYTVYQHNLDTTYHWLDDLVIDAYVFALCHHHGNAIHLQSHSAVQWDRGNYTTPKRSLETDFVCKRWLVGGVNVYGNHWTLLVADSHQQVYYELNSLRRIKSKAIDHFSFSKTAGQHEINPENLWKQVIQCIRSVLTDTKLSMNHIKCVGIASQRNTFITWNRTTGEPYHNFISWQDLRSSDLVLEWNESLTMKLIRAASKCIYWLTRSQQFLLASLIKFSTIHVNMKLLWVLNNVPSLKRDASRNEVLFGTVDTWLVWKLTNGTTHATDFSLASSTGIFDPTKKCWSPFLCKLLSIPISIFPTVKNTCDDFGMCKLFGVSIPITCIVADQQASMYGLGCVLPSMVKCTLGTGGFLDVNTGNRMLVCDKDIYPMIAWSLDDVITYMVEGNSGDCGSLVDLIGALGIYDDIKKLGILAENSNETGEVVVLSAFCGIQGKINDAEASFSIVGAKPSTNRGNVARATLESIANRLRVLKDTCQRELTINIKEIRVDGGVSQCDFLLNLISNSTQCTLKCSKISDATSYGAYLLANYKNMQNENTPLLLKEPQFTDISNTDKQLFSTSNRRFNSWLRANVHAKC